MATAPPPSGEGASQPSGVLPVAAAAAVAAAGAAAEEAQAAAAAAAAHIEQLSSRVSELESEVDAVVRQQVGEAADKATWEQRCSELEGVVAQLTHENSSLAAANSGLDTPLMRQFQRLLAECGPVGKTHLRELARHDWFRKRAGRPPAKAPPPPAAAAGTSQLGTQAADCRTAPLLASTVHARQAAAATEAGHLQHKLEAGSTALHNDTPGTAAATTGAMPPPPPSDGPDTQELVRGQPHAPSLAAALKAKPAQQLEDMKRELHAALKAAAA
ncbi:hypothetical protein CHLRE_07g342052v5 [Chlamydomonas reinhardtii]|uniref:Uncharacterized protein n=1 Tax=Chlamydomonas reinhardtii TaxID=3055 RepID=A0A2K3DKK6_CHLRE|nr:uncharacterized protein CHLRE_07g342052v5 [Chlamydomonas reinhardtii]PNW81077.1 hypothetical protein CHLRE_07g342052v5 [Chlamydomonas reinhardtii]